MNEADYRRVMGVQCSAQLRTLLNGAFALYDETPPDPDHFAYIAPGEDGNCRIMDERGWCRLHSECGEHLQPTVCRRYPRAVHPGEITEAVCSGSCEKVIEMLMELDAPLHFLRKEVEVCSPVPEYEDPGERMRNLRRESLAVWQEPGITPAEKLSRIADLLGVRLTADESLILPHACLLMRSYSGISETMRRAAAPVLRFLHAETEDAENTPALWESARRTALCRMPAAEQAIENILANHMYYVRFPLAEGHTPAAVFDGLYGAYAVILVMTLVSAAAAETDADVPVRFADAAAAALRTIEHTDFVRNAHIILRA